MRFDREHGIAADDDDQRTGIGRDDMQYVGQAHRDHRQPDVAPHRAHAAAGGLTAIESEHMICSVPERRSADR